MSKKMNKIAAEYGCVIMPAAFGATCLAVLGQYQQGWISDRQTIARCMDAMRAAGISTAGWVS